MGDVFETTMPEQVYTDKISDLESRLHEVEMILVNNLLIVWIGGGSNKPSPKNRTRKVKEWNVLIAITK